jgi:WD40 repeat protein
MYHIKNEKMNYPITRLAWQHVYQYKVDSAENILWGSCCDGHIIRWSSNAGTKVEHTLLNAENKYNTIDCAGDGRHVVVGGTIPQIEIWDVTTM